MKWLPEELEAVHCDSCRRTDFATKYERPDGLTVVECKNCHLAFVNPRPKPHVVGRFYEVGYFSKAQSREPHSHGIGYASYLDGEGYQDMVQQTKIRFEIVSELFDFREKRVLEIGCATGEFCNLAARAGAFVEGIDVSDAAITCARQRFPEIPFKAIAVESVSLEENYDLVVAFEVIEHVTSPKRFVQILARQLKLQGVMALSTPNCDCARHLDWVHWDGFRRSFEHLHYFGAAELADLGRAHGLSPMTWYSWGGWPSDQPQAKSRMLAKRWLATLGLMTVARKFRGKYKAIKPRYQQNGNQGNLLMLFRKQL
jgi:SAM-dependent methyltransferase